jgi:hypothetical protein
MSLLLPSNPGRHAPAVSRFSQAARDTDEIVFFSPPIICFPSSVPRYLSYFNASYDHFRDNITVSHDRPLSKIHRNNDYSRDNNNNKVHHCPRLDY